MDSVELNILQLYSSTAGSGTHMDQNIVNVTFPETILRHSDMCCISLFNQFFSVVQH